MENNLHITKKKSTLRNRNLSRNSKIILLACFVGSLNVVLHDSYILSTLVVFFEIIMLAYWLFIKKSITDYIGYYLIFLSLSLEFAGFTSQGNVYGFKDFRIAGVNLGILALLPVLLKLIIKGVKTYKVKKELPKLYRFSAMIFFLSFTGMFFGLFQIIINDNNIQHMESFFRSFVNTSYNMMAISILMIISFLYIISWEENKIKNLSIYLTSILFGTVWMLCSSILFNKVGTYGGVDTLIVSNTVAYLPFIFILASRRDVTHPKVYYIMGVIGITLALIYNSTGKLIILLLVSFYFFYKQLIKSGKPIKRLLGIMTMPILFSLGFYAINAMKKMSILFSSKFNQAFSLLAFWNPNWFLNLPNSPRVRVIQFINIGIEYLNKPWFAVFGKGYMGTFRDHIYGFASIQNDLGAFSLDQWNHGAFYRPHETLNVIFLYHGLVGLLFYVYSALFIFKNSEKSQWLLIGGVWFLLFYGYSITLSAFGITSLLLGLYEVDKN